MMPALGVLALLLAAGPEEPVARVDGDVVTARDLATRIGSTRAAGGAIQPDGLVQDLVNEVLLAREAERAGLVQDPEVVMVVEAQRRRLAAAWFSEHEIAATGKLDDAALLEIFHQTADSVHLHSIMVATEEEATALKARLVAGADFAVEARSSLSPDTAARGGDQGIKSRGQLPGEVAEVAFSAPLNSIAGPVKLALGFSVVKVSSRNVGDAASFAARKTELRRFAEQQATAQARHHYVQQLRKQAEVRLDEVFLASTGKRLKATPAEAAHALTTVHGRPVLYGEVVADVERLSRGNSGGHASGQTVKLELAWARVDQLLLEEAAMKFGAGDQPPVRAGVAAVRREALVRTLVEQLRRQVPAPAKESLEAFYRSHLADYTEPARRVCAHLVTATREQSVKLAGRVARGEAFEELARQYSLDKATAGAGGLLGELSEPQLATLAGADGEPALAKALREAAPLTVAAPVQSRMGFHLVRCAAPSPARVAPLDGVQAAIAARINREEGDARVRAKIAELRGKAQISVDQAALARASGK